MIRNIRDLWLVYILFLMSCGVVIYGFLGIEWFVASAAIITVGFLVYAGVKFGPRIPVFAVLIALYAVASIVGGRSWANILVLIYGLILLFLTFRRVRIVVDHEHHYFLFREFKSFCEKHLGGYEQVKLIVFLYIISSLFIISFSMTVIIY